MDMVGLRSHGRFWLHLCPEHPDGLDGHLPETDNPGEQGVAVSCSCGVQLGLHLRNAKAVWLKHFEETSRAEGYGWTGEQR